MQAEECYAFLGDVKFRGSEGLGPYKLMKSSEWFKRGWTLQELIAPAEVQFYDQEGAWLASRTTHAGFLEMITSIPFDVLRGEKDPGEYSIAQRMCWAALRKTTRPEDVAYSLLGIFKVNMPMLYGEHENAFRRLQEEIVKQSEDQSLFAWQDNRQHHGRVLASSPYEFRSLQRLQCIYVTNDTRFGHTLNNSGLAI